MYSRSAAALFRAVLQIIVDQRGVVKQLRSSRDCHGVPIGHAQRDAGVERKEGSDPLPTGTEMVGASAQQWRAHRGLGGSADAHRREHLPLDLREKVKRGIRLHQCRDHDWG